MNRILSIDASTEACSVALLNDKNITELYQVSPREHANLLLPNVKELLTEANLTVNDLDAVGCIVGPGAFTGIRIGVSVAQGLAFAANLPVVPVSSLHNMAIQSFASNNKQSATKYCLAAIDARMNEVYFAVFENQEGIVSLVDSKNCQEQVIAPELIDLNAILSMVGDDYALVGTGWNAYKNIFSQTSLDYSKLTEIQFPKASASLSIIETALNAEEIIKPEQLQPTYLRNQVAKKKSEQK